MHKLDWFFGYGFSLSQTKLRYERYISTSKVMLFNIMSLELIIKPSSEYDPKTD